MGISTDEAERRVESASDRGGGAASGTARDRLDRASERVATWRTRGWTTIVLEEGPDGTWRATQEGVATVGHGETAADAAAAYCSRVGDGGSAMDDEPVDERPVAGESGVIDDA